MTEREKADSNYPDGDAPPGSVGPVSDPRNRRSAERIEVTWSVDCETEDTFLYAAIANISELGIFVKTTDPLPQGTHLTLRFAPPNLDGPLAFEGKVQWVNHVKPLADNPNPGMGIRFINLKPEDRETLVEIVRTIAYLRDEPPSN